MDEKALPQVRELLTNYGPIGLIWFDTPIGITQKQSQEFYDLVHRLQPNCLVNSRVGYGLGDYGSEGDNQIPGTEKTQDWETPATINDTWGYKSYDKNWKSVKDLLFNLVDIVSKGGNYLLNVGPDARGIIPRASVERLKKIGQWIKLNGESIYGIKTRAFCPSSLGTLYFPAGKAISAYFRLAERR